MIKTIINAKVVTTSDIKENHLVIINNGVIEEIGKNLLPKGEVIDACGSYLIPGFIDLHCHGGMELDFIDATKQEVEKIARLHLANGTTSLVATTLTASEEVTENCLKTVSAVIDQNPDGNLVGIHMEGPWFSPAEAGAQDPRFMKVPCAKDIERLKESYPHLLRVSVAPEVDDGFAFGKRANELGVVVSAGHTGADFDTITNAYENGYKLLTHFYSGMKGVFRKNAYRTAGAVEAGYYLDDMDVEIIADGKHLPKTLLKLIYKIKGADRVSLITDATRGCGLKNGAKSFIGEKNFAVPIVIEDDVAFMEDKQAFAGSTATFDRLYRTMADAIGKDMVSLSKMASTNPARILNLTDRGEIAQGKRADLIIMNENLQIQKILLKGKEIL